MRLNSLRAKDRKVFERFLGLRRHSLSVYAFANIYIWKALFKIYWAEIEGCLCVFFKDDTGAFLNFPPLARKNNPAAVAQAFDILDGLNTNKDVSRIENIGEEDVSFYRRSGYCCRLKSHDYLCSRPELAGLKGNRFKSKRSSRNYFTKNYQYEYFKFSLKHRDSCLKLYDEWAVARALANSDNIYRGMLEDSRRCLGLLLNSYKDLDITGRLVEVEGRLKAFTFGFELSNNTFCILYEVADLSVKGLAQFIFSEFCRDLKSYKCINVMDDSGLENLRKVKLSYHPVKLVPAYIARRHG